MYFKSRRKNFGLAVAFCVHIKVIFGGGNNIGNDIAVLLCYFFKSKSKKALQNSMLYSRMYML